MNNPSSLEITTDPGAMVDGGGDPAFVAVGAGEARSPNTSTKRSFDGGAAAGGWLLGGVPAIPSKSPVVAAG